MHAQLREVQKYHPSPESPLGMLHPVLLVMVLPVSDGALSWVMMGSPVAKKSMTVANISAFNSFHSISSSSYMIGIISIKHATGLSACAEAHANIHLQMQLVLPCT